MTRASMVDPRGAGSRGLQRAVPQARLRPGRETAVAWVFRGLALVEVDAETGLVVRVDIAASAFGQAGEDVEKGIARAFQRLDHEVGRLGARPFLHAEIARGQVD